MRDADLHTDGWCLEDGEAYHASAPDTFAIPSRADRENLWPGDLVKLIFRIQVDSAKGPVAFERMWVLVRERRPDGYLRVRDNDPSSIGENEELWSGSELPFRARHVIAIDRGDAETRVLALQEPRRRWPGSQAGGGQP
ncbi:DUF2314 domain-containing protein [Novosphingobium sp. BW1]|uniref:DUF2314 domain-containing protein n=1 Tax=Novosphingobium sp. BW1 TaxID=2592621 RepID=UPI0011DEEED3|nr:DUF2314 domain-containing protein [Novosphingobium sp. BW1]TYC89901.1 DUF2314 domain-containing protein [Novosphingobium sp. BW1]